MEKFTKLKSKIVPLPLKDVDTDMIIPAQFLTSISREGFGENLFRRLRDQDPNFCLNQERYKGARILVADENFACGSSREHAVWALTGAGFKVVIAKSFADIFFSNSAKNGLLLIELPADVVDSLLAQAQASDVELEVDLEGQKVRLKDGSEHHFNYDAFRKHCLLNGLEDLDYLLSKKNEIETFRGKQEEIRFYQTV